MTKRVQLLTIFTLLPRRVWWIIIHTSTRFPIVVLDIEIRIKWETFGSWNYGNLKCGIYVKRKTNWAVYVNVRKTLRAHVWYLRFVRMDENRKRAMACATRLCSSSLSHALFPVLINQTALSTKLLRFNRLYSTARLFSSPNRTNLPLLTQAKRRYGFSTKEDPVASRKQTS